MLLTCPDEAFVIMLANAIKLVDNCKGLRIVSAQGLYQSHVSSSLQNSMLKYIAQGEVEFQS